VKYSLGVDIGGSFVRVAIVDEMGAIHYQQAEPTIKQDKLKLLAQLKAMIQVAIDMPFDIVGIGIGISGPVTPNIGYVHALPNIGVEDLDVRQYLAEFFSVPIYVVNDANAAGLAEALLGAGRGHRVVQYVTLSTGIGGGLIINGKIWTGTHGFAQEIGNMIIKPGRPSPNSQMNPDSFESWCSGASLVKIANEKGISVLTTKDVFDNPICAPIVDEWIDHLGIALSNLYNILEPDVIVLGGGIMKSSARFFNRILPSVTRYVYKQTTKHVLIKQAELGQNSGLIGAALLSFHRQ
jgi:glucokinase